MRKFLWSLLFLAGGLAGELRQPFGPFCPVPARAQPLPRRGEKKQ